MTKTEMLKTIKDSMKVVEYINAGVGIIFLVMLFVALWQWSIIHFIAALIVWVIFLIIHAVASLRMILAINVFQIESDISKGI